MAQVHRSDLSRGRGRSLLRRCPSRRQGSGGTRGSASSLCSTPWCRSWHERTRGRWRRGGSSWLTSTRARPTSGTRSRLPRIPLPRHGCRRPCDPQRQVPAVRSSDSVHLLTHGISDATQRQVPTVHSFMLPVQFLDKVLDMPVVVLRQVLRSMVQKTVVVPQLQSIEGRRLPVVPQKLIPMVQTAQADHGDSAVAAHFGGRCPCCAGRADSKVLPWRRPWRSHSCSSLRSRRSLYSDCRKTADFPQLHFIKVVVFLL